MSRLSHSEIYRMHRIGWLRAAVGARPLGRVVGCLWLVVVERWFWRFET